MPSYLSDTETKVLLSGICCFLLLILGYITLVCYLGVYAYNNPTPYATTDLGCYVIEDATTSTALPAPNTDPVNVQARWNTFFLWAFWTNIAGLVLGPAEFFWCGELCRF